MRRSERIRERAATRARAAPPAAAGAPSDAVVSWAALPRDALVCVLRFLNLEGSADTADARMLVACASVCASWRAAVVDTPSLWARFAVGSSRRVARAFDDTALTRLVRLSAGGLASASVDGATKLTGAAAALFSPAACPSLRSLSLTGCVGIPPRAMVAALRGASLESLSIAGLKAEGPPSEEATSALFEDLHALLCDGGVLDVVNVCSKEHEHGRGCQSCLQWTGRTKQRGATCARRRPSAPRTTTGETLTATVAAPAERRCATTALTIFSQASTTMPSWTDINADSAVSCCAASAPSAR